MPRRTMPLPDGSVVVIDAIIGVSSVNAEGDSNFTTYNFLVHLSNGAAIKQVFIQEHKAVSERSHLLKCAFADKGYE